MVFRTGNRHSEFANGEYIQESMGSAFSQDRKSAIGIICYAIGRQLNIIYEEGQRRLNQKFPETMTYDLERWYEFLGVSSSGVSDKEKRATISRLFKRFANPPTRLNVKNYLEEMLGDVFIQIKELSPDLVVDNDGHTIGSFPGGLVNDVVNIRDGEMNSSLAFLPVRIWNPRNELDQEKYGVAEFLEVANSFYNEMGSYLPATSECDWFVFAEQCIGTISCASNSTSVTGTGTVFANGVEPMVAGEILEVVCDDGVRVDLEVVSQFGDGLMVIKTAPGHTITNKKFRRQGIFVGQDGNLGYAAFH